MCNQALAVREAHVARIFKLARYCRNRIYDVIRDDHSQDLSVSLLYISLSLGVLAAHAALLRT